MASLYDCECTLRRRGGLASEEKETLTFYIKSAGRWTEALYNYAYAYDLTQATRDLTQATKDVTIQIRGPHGGTKNGSVCL